MVAPHRLQPIGRAKLVEGEGLDRLEHGEPGPSGGIGRAGDEAAVGQRQQVLESIRRPAVGGTDRVDLLDVEPALEYREHVQELLQGRLELVVAPGDGAFQRSLASRGISRAGSGQRESCGEPIPDDRRRQEPDTRRGQLDPERQVIEQLADLADDLDIRPRFPAWTDCIGAGTEQGCCFGSQWLDRHLVFPAEMWSGARLVTMNREPGDARTTAAI